MLPIFETPDLPPTGLRAFAEYLEKLANFIRDHANNNERQNQHVTQNRERFDTAKSAFKKLGQIVAHQMSTGTSYKIAVQLTTAATGYDAEAVSTLR